MSYNLVPARYHRATVVGIVTAFAWAALVLARPAEALSIARTREGIQKKAVIITQNAKLFARSSGTDGTRADFMQIFFLLDGESEERIPVTLGPNEEDPDGWLERSTFAEWNTLQMIDFEPQSGRELARIFSDAGCAEGFGLSGTPGSCKELGSEPQLAGSQRNNYRLLVPILERDRDNYRGGFVRVASEGPAVKPQTDSEVGARPVSSRIGYDLILVVDSTASMEKWFKPTAQALDSFLGSVRQQIGSGESKTPFRIGLLFYRDRKTVPDCDIGYLFHWAVELTDDVSAVSRALAGASEASCGSDEAPEAVYDALSRAVQDPKWKDGHFKVVLLIGDSPPHPPDNKDKNPLGFDVGSITRMAEERNVRLMTFKIGTSDAAEFKGLALSGNVGVQGRFRAIEPDTSVYRSALLEALNEEWNLLTKANLAIHRSITRSLAQRDSRIFSGQGVDVGLYDIPIIIANLPPEAAGSGAPEFVQGWVPKKIKQKLAVGEYVFMNKLLLQSFVNIIDNIALAAQEGSTEGGEIFIASLRSSLATMLKVQPEDLFRSGEPLDSIMAKAQVLPFKTTVLSFTAEEVNAWKPADFQRLNRILAEKTTALREYAQKPANTHMFGDKPHIYVPRDLFP